MKAQFLISLLFLITACSKTLRPQQLLVDVQELSSDKYEGRKTGTTGNLKAAEYIIKRFEEIGLNQYKGTWKQPFELSDSKRRGKTGQNLIGFIPGKRSEVIVISAHYDHLGIINGQIYNGADDNASGVAGLLAMATYFKKNPPEFTLLFVCFDSEENGLQGSKAFVKHPPVELNNIILDINLDMISRADKGEIYACGTYHYPAFKKYLVSKNPKIRLLLGHDDPKSGINDWTNQSDHYSFYQKNIPFIYFGVEDHKDYHKPTDDFSRINKEVFLNISDLLIGIVSDIDKQLSFQKNFRDKLIMKD